MEKRIKIFLSIFVIGFFGFLALACDDDYEGSSQPVDCDDPYFWLRETLNPPVTSVNEYKLTLLDKETNQPVSGIYVKAHWNLVKCSYDLQNCPLHCTIDFGIGYSAEHFTDGNGYIEGLTFPYKFQDKKDRVLVVLDIEDLHGVYASKRISIRYDYSLTSKSYTAYLIKNDAL